MNDGKIMGTVNVCGDCEWNEKGQKWLMKLINRKRP